MPTFVVQKKGKRVFVDKLYKSVKVVEASNPSEAFEKASLSRKDFIRKNSGWYEKKKSSVR
jgi:hypothetical protein